MSEYKVLNRRSSSNTSSMLSDEWSTSNSMSVLENGEVSNDNIKDDLNSQENSVNAKSERRDRQTTHAPKTSNTTRTTLEYDQLETPRSSFTAQTRPQKPHQPFFVYSMLFIDVLLFIVTMGVNNWNFEPFAVNPLLGPSVAALEKMGAQRTDLVYAGEWWRLFTSMFLHAGIIHLLFNMFALHQLGKDLEVTFGSWRVIFIYFVSGLLGSIASAIFEPDYFGVGASGAIFGLFGALFAEFIQNWHMYQDRCKQLTNLIVVTVLNLLIGLLPFVNNYAHIGGLLCGFCIGFFLLVLPEYDQRTGDRKPLRRRQFALLLIGAIGLAALYLSCLVCLFTKVDVHEVCPWCKYLSCVETPLWSCDKSANASGQCSGRMNSNGRLVVTCPNGNEVEASAGVEFTRELCTSLCF